MRNYIFQLLVVTLVLSLPLVAFGQSSSDDFDTKVEKGIERVNTLMVEKDRDRSLDAIDDVLALLDTQEGKAYQDTGQKLDRLKFFLSKYNWDRARRILKSTMEDLDLEYQPTYP